MGSPRPNPTRSEGVRLQKFLAEAGLGSRRACEDLIRRGEVFIDDAPATELGRRVDPDRQKVTVRGRPVSLQPKLYLMLNKPRGVLCTSSDPQGRGTFRDLLPDLPARVYTVGRLDADSEGLLLVTNDGDFAFRLTHPRHHVQKVYWVWVDDRLSPEQLNLLRRGIPAREGRLVLDRIAERRGSNALPCYEVEVHEGRNRQIRRMFEHVEARVRRLQRVRIGPWALGGLRTGEFREMTREEVRRLR